MSTDEPKPDAKRAETDQGAGNASHAVADADRGPGSVPSAGSSVQSLDPGAATRTGFGARVSLPNLGDVRIQVVREEHGASSILIASDRHETHRALSADADQLHELLDQAGVETNGRTVRFESADPSGSAAADSAAGGGERGAGAGNREERRPSPDGGAGARSDVAVGFQAPQRGSGSGLSTEAAAVSARGIDITA